MGSAVHFILLFSGLWALALCASRQFYLVDKINEMKNWTRAQEWCRDHYTDLATIENEEDMNAVKKLLKEKQNKFWIGLRQNETTQKSFSNVSWFWSDGAQYNYSYWQYGEPNNDGPNNCVEVYPGNNTWNDANCSHSNLFICYKKRIPLTMITEEMTWKEALRYCRQNHVDLVSVYSQEMQDWVAEVISRNVSCTNSVWIGLRHTCALGFWYWVTGETICYQNWAPGNGTGVEDCGDVERTGAMLTETKNWVSLPQTQRLNFICITF